MLPAAPSGEEAGWSARSSGHSFPDGLPVTVHVAFVPRGATVSDLGQTLAWVRESASGKLLAPRLRAQILALCRLLDVTLEAGSLLVEVGPGGDVGEAVERVGRAAERVAHLCF